MGSKVSSFSIPMTIVLAIAGFTLCAVSLWYTINLLSSLGANEEEEWLMTITAIGFEACKFTFVPIAFAFISHRRGIEGAFVLCIGAALVGVSVVASLGFLAAKTDQGVEKARIESDEYKSSQVTLNIIDTSIATLSAAAELDSKSKYSQVRKSAAEKILQVDALEEKRYRTTEEMENIDAMSKTDTGALFISLASGWSMTAENVKKFAYIIVAILLELCSIATLYLAGVGALKVNEKPPASDKPPLISRKHFFLPRFLSWFSRSTCRFCRSSTQEQKRS